MTSRPGWKIMLGMVVLTVGVGLITARWSLERAERSALEPAGPDWGAVLESVPEEGFARPTGPWRLHLPEDHGAHEDARTEAWSISMRLATESGEPMSVQISWLRLALVDPASPERESAWQAREVYRGHVLVARGSSDESIGRESLSRGSLGLAGHDATARRVWLDAWVLHYDAADRLEVEARLDGYAMRFELKPAKAPVALDEEGGAAPFRGYAVTRMSVTGVIADASEERLVEGTAWLDHLWGDIPLPTGPVVWDRLRLQLDDGSDLSIVRSRRRNGTGQPTISGFLVDAHGVVEAIDDAVVQMTPVDGRGAGKADSRYPLHWQVELGDTRLDIAPLHEVSGNDFTTPMWSGVVEASGIRSQGSLTGTGYLDLTGYVDR